MKTNKQLTFSLLSTIDQPLLPNYINSIHEKGLKNIIVLIDSNLYLIKIERSGKKELELSFLY